MTTTASGRDIGLSLAFDAADDDALVLARRLRAELLDLDVSEVEALGAGTAPAGAKAGLELSGGLAVKLAPAVLKAVVAKIRDWARRNNCAVRVTLDGDTIYLAHPTAEQQEQVVNAWLARHAASS